MILHGDTSILDENTAIMLEILGTKVPSLPLHEIPVRRRPRVHDLRAEW